MASRLGMICVSPRAVFPLLVVFRAGLLCIIPHISTRMWFSAPAWQLKDGQSSQTHSQTPPLAVLRRLSFPKMNSGQIMDFLYFIVFFRRGQQGCVQYFVLGNIPSFIIQTPVTLQGLSLTHTQGF